MSAPTLLPASASSSASTSTADATKPVPAKPLTADDLMALPDDDGVERELIRGELWEWPMTRRNRLHSGTESKIVFILMRWLEGRPEPRGKVHCGEAAFRIQSEPETFVGIDVAYASPELVASTDPKRPYYDGPPVLAVEILSPSDTHERITAKIRAYLEAGVVVWEVDPDFQTVRVYQPNQAPVMSNVTQELSAEPYLPNFRVVVKEFFY